MNPIHNTNWTRRVRATLNGLIGGGVIELLANLAWLG
jgi:hypothetical protein